MDNATNTIKAVYPVVGMQCAACAARIEKVLGKQQGVQLCNVNLAAGNISLAYNPDEITIERLAEVVANMGFQLVTIGGEDAATQVEERERVRYKELRNNVVWSIVMSVPIMLLSMVFHDIPYAQEIMAVLATPVVFYFGRGFFVNAWKQLKQKTANMDTLVALSVGVSYCFSIFNMIYPEFWEKRGVEPHVYFEASAMIVVFIMIGRMLEERAKGNTSEAIKKLMGLAPKTAMVVTESGELRETLIDYIKEGSVIAVRPGEKVPVDGVVTNGMSVEKTEGSEVFAGTINQKGAFQMKATKVGSATMLATIIKMVQDAQGSKAPIQRIVDKVAGVFVPVIVTIALLSMVAWCLWGGNDGVVRGVLAFVTVVIIACPCALGLATPTAIMVGMGKGAEKGILIKDAKSLEIAKKIEAVVLDKTGTITEGRPEVADVVYGANVDVDACAGALYSIEMQSEHPLAEAIVRHFKSLDANSVSVAGFEAVVGGGVKGEVDGKYYFVGNAKFLKSQGVKMEQDLAVRANELEDESKTVVWLADEERSLTLIAITDRVKATSAAAVAKMHEMGVAVYMLTGDNRVTAEAVARQVGIKNYKAQMLPSDKAEFVARLQAEGHCVAMVGDGINDSAALAQADMGVAMGQGSDIAIDIAKMAIVGNDLMKIPEAIELSKKIVRTIHQNLFWAFIYNVIGVPVAAGALYPVCGFLLNPMIAGAAMALSSVSVVTNSLRSIKNE